MSDPCANLKRRICPFISSGEVIVRCKGTQCNACRPVLLEDGEPVWVCAMIEREFSDSWEVAPGVYA